MSIEFLEGYDLGYHDEIPVIIEEDDADFSEFLAGYREGLEMRRER